MRIGINASFIRKLYTGIGQVSLNFLRKLGDLKLKNEKGKPDEFFVYLEEELPEDMHLPGNFQVRVFLPPWKRDDLIRKIWWEKYLLPRAAKKDKCDVFLSLYQSTAILSNIAVPHVMVVHDIIPRLFPEYLDNYRKRMYQRLVEKAIKKADRIVAVSKRTEKDLIGHLGIDAGKIAAHYIDADEIFRKEIGQSESGRVLKKYGLGSGYIYTGGGLEVRKNIESVLHAYRFLLDRNKNEHFISKMPTLVISGKLLPQLAPLVTDVEKVTKKLNLAPHVKILGFVPQEDLPAIYQNAIMFVYPSHYEGFGLPVLEAMNVGTPVVTSKTSALPEVGGDSVLYCDPDDVRDIAMVIKNLLVNKNLREILVQRGKARAARFSWDEFVENLLNIVSVVK